ncbi:SEC-C domain-containing protein [Streptococcus sp. ZJ93]|uniref:SEC-C domain-containing protein n=1 Tax=Streptococcus handemini TaxID=3161188 RepID=UPI0032EC2C10
MSINRNDKCPCGSDNKYKKCCMRILPVSSKDYLNNNFEMINFYKKLYQDEVNIDWITRQLTSGFFSSLLLRDLFRYRVFIDSLMLLFNKERELYTSLHQLQYVVFLTIPKKATAKWKSPFVFIFSVRELYTSLHQLQYVVFLTIPKKATAKWKSPFVFIFSVNLFCVISYLKLKNH